MGMFDKDKEIGLILTTWIDPREEFIIHGASVIREDFPTELGPTPQVEMEVSKVQAPRTTYKVTTLASAIVAKVREAEGDDFPAVVMWFKTPSRYGQDAQVLQFVRPWNAAVDRRPVPGQGTASQEARGENAVDDIARAFPGSTVEEG